VKVFGGVLVRRRVTAAHVATGHAQAQVHPCAADAQAVFTSIRAGCDFFYLIEVCTNVSHIILLIKYLLDNHDRILAPSPIGRGLG